MTYASPPVNGYRLFEEGGFEVVRNYTTRDEAEPSASLTEIYSYDILTTNQIVLLLKKEKAHA